MSLLDWRSCPNYVPNNSESGLTEAAHADLGFRGSYLSFRPRPVVFWQAQLGWGWAELLPREKNLLFFLFSFSSRHTGAAEYWSQSIKSGHMSELFIVGSQPVGRCLAGLLHCLMLPIFEAAASQQLGQSWCVWRRLKDREKNNYANLCFILFMLQRALSSLVLAPFSLVTRSDTY